jgi:hypothetical protein
MFCHARYSGVRLVRVLSPCFTALGFAPHHTQLQSGAWQKPRAFAAALIRARVSAERSRLTCFLHVQSGAHGVRS